MIFEAVCNFKGIQVVGFIHDLTLAEEDICANREHIEKRRIPEMTLDKVEETAPDIIFLCGYMKILKTNLLDKYLFLNIHGGILPKWRGLSCNSWSIVNGEEKIGYSIHRVREELDDGELYKVFSVTLNRNEKYGDARKRLKQKVCEELEDCFVQIIEGRLLPVAQDKRDIVYTTRFRKEDGKITDWDITTSKLMGLYRVLGYPYGSGIFITIKGEEYEVLEMGEGEVSPSIGSNGPVVFAYDDGSVLIKTLDTAVRVYQLRNSLDEVIIPGNILKIGARL